MATKVACLNSAFKECSKPINEANNFSRNLKRKNKYTLSLEITKITLLCYNNKKVLGTSLYEEKKYVDTYFEKKKKKTSSNNSHTFVHYRKFNASIILIQTL